MATYRPIILLLFGIVAVAIADDGLPIGGGVEGELSDPASIVGGTPSASGTYPFFATPENSLGLCGATLIHADILMTAAHCYRSWKGYNACIGATKRDCSDASESILAEQDYIHPDYNPNFALRENQNDIMLIKLESPSSALLATWNKNATIPEEDTIVIATGLGRIETSSLPDALLEVKLTVADSATCARASDDFSLPEKTICAYGDGRAGICGGDS